MVRYEPLFNQITGSVNASIFLGMVIDAQRENNGEAFFRFKAPCDHSRYADGRSWCEMAGFSKREIDTARSKVSFCVVSKAKYAAMTEKEQLEHDEAKGESLVWYSVNLERLTYYKVNQELLSRLCRLKSIPVNLVNTGVVDLVNASSVNLPEREEKKPVNAGFSSGVTELDFNR